MKAFGDEAIARLREALREDESSHAPEGCPTREELWESAAGELDPPDDERIVLHLGRCGECSLVWRLGREMLASDAVTSSPVMPVTRPSRRHTWRRVLIPALAATVLIGMGLGTAWLVRQGDSSSPVFRRQRETGGIVASPSTRTLPRTACRLEWSAGPEGTHYDLTTTDERLEVLATVNGLTRPEYVLPMEAIPASATAVFWRVTAHLPDGRTFSSATFTTRIADVAPDRDTVAGDRSPPSRPGLE